MSQPEALLRLQDIELHLLRDQKRLAEIAALIADDRELSAAQAAVAQAQEALVPLRTRARNLELEIQSNGQKAQDTEKLLYSGKVKNTKEMQDMQAEIAALKRRNGELEDHLLEVMMSVEDHEAALADAEAALRQTEEARGSTHETLRDEQATLEREVARLKTQRETALQEITPENLAKYNALKPKKHNQPVALLQNGSCSVCGVEQTMAIERQVQVGQSLVTCLSCGRILVYKQ